MGNVVFNIDSVDVEWYGPKFKTPIAGKTVKQFVSSIIPVLNKLSQYIKPEETADADKLVKLTTRIDELGIEAIKATYSGVERSRSYDNDRPPSRTLSIIVDSTPDEELLRKVKDYSSFFKVYNITLPGMEWR